MRFRVGNTLTYDVAVPTTVFLNVEPCRLARQAIIDEAMTIVPGDCTVATWKDVEGGRWRSLRVAPGRLTLRYEAEVDHTPLLADPESIGETAVADLPPSVVPYLFPSRYCPADRLAAYAAAEFGALPPGHARITAICNWIYEHLDYRRGASDEHTTAIDTLVERAGVCRDFAHLGITLTRALGVPARFVSAYAWQLDPPDFHAVFEAFLDGRWWLFDPTRQAALDGLVRIGVGRDAADTAFGNVYGDAELSAITVWIEPIGFDGIYEPTVQAVSISDEPPVADA